MNIRIIMVIMVIYFCAAIIGGWGDGAFMSASSESDLEAVSQTASLVSNPYEGISEWNVGGLFFATLGYLKGWANILTLNFSIFQGSVGTFVRSAILTIVCAPVLLGLISWLKP